MSEVLSDRIVDMATARGLDTWETSKAVVHTVRLTLAKPLPVSQVPVSTEDCSVCTNASNSGVLLPHVTQPTQ